VTGGTPTKPSTRPSAATTSRRRKPTSSPASPIGCRSASSSTVLPSQQKINSLACFAPFMFSASSIILVVLFSSELTVWNSVCLSLYQYHARLPPLQLPTFHMHSYLTIAHNRTSAASALDSAVARLLARGLVCFPWFPASPCVCLPGCFLVWSRRIHHVPPCRSEKRT